MRALTLAPLPGWVTLAGALFRPASRVSTLSAPWCGTGDEAFWFSRSAWSLAAVAKLSQLVRGRTQTIIWIPDYFCNGSLAPLRATGARLVFYPITSELEPDYRVCRTTAKQHPPDLFVLAHYFGTPARAERAAEFCTYTGSWLVEDATHVLQPITGVGGHGDFVLYSPHKHLPLPDGAVLVARRDGSALRGLAHFPSTQLAEICQTVINSAAGRPQFPLRWITKRVLQMLGVRSVRRVVADFHVDAPSGQLPHPQMSGIARRMLSLSIPSLQAERRARLRNQKVWDHLLATTSGLQPARRTTKEQSIPYLAEFFCSEPGRAEAVYYELQRHGLPVTTWPDLPPEVTQNIADHAQALQLRQQKIYLAVHRSINVAQMARKHPVGRSRTGSVAAIEVKWNMASRAEWEAWLCETGRSNLLQSWAYGEAKRQMEGWRVKRAVFLRGGRLIAFAQILHKSYLGLVHVYRINRGPLFIGTASDDVVAEVMEILSRLGRWWHGRLLAIAPEMEDSGSGAVALARLAYRYSLKQAWSSVLVDLGIDLGQLRRALNGKWRNMLVVSEKQGMVLEVGADEPLFVWMLERYGDLMAQKNFSGISPRMLKALRSNLGDKRRLLIMRAMYHGEPVAGICVARHGVAATYLIGWNSEVGRKLKANHFLLWNAIVQLKISDCRWFDLGGVDEINTPGIAEFKLGLNGERYELIGEYVCS